MLARLIMALMLAAFAMPSVAARPCHDAPAMDHRMPGPARDHAPDKAVPPHGCIGCIPLADWTAARLPAPVLAVQANPVPIALRLDLGRGWPPALPPPRIG